MVKQKRKTMNMEENNIRFVPTEAEQYDSRRTIEKIQKESRPFARLDFELVLKTAAKPLK